MAETELPNPDELRELKEKPFTKKVALVTAMFAVCLAIVSLGGNNAMKEMLLAQQQSSNQWSYYQAKVLREHLYRGQKMRLELDLAIAGNSLSPASRQQMNETLKQFAGEEERYRTEKKEIEQEAKTLEHERDINRAKDPYFDYAEVLLQIAIVMASISILASSTTIFSFALVSAILGVLMGINGFFLLVHIPFL
jgi:hypothetical protein